MKVALDNDLKRYEEYISAKTARREDIQSFRAGDAVVILPNGRQFITHFLRRESKHGSHTPHLTQALLLPVGQAGLQPAQPYQPPAPQAGRSVLPEQIAFRQPGSDALPNPPGAAGGVPRAFALEPYAQQVQPGASAQVPVSWQETEKSQHVTKALGPELQTAYDAYRPGMHHHTLARHLGTTPAVAGHLLKQLQMRGLIDAAGNKTVASPQVSQEDLRQYDRVVAVWHELEGKKCANVRDFAAAMHMGETNAWELLTKLDRLGLIHWERRKKRDVV